ncbi:31372_t:CDS:2, partial [Gigaspora margarita]
IIIKEFAEMGIKKSGLRVVNNEIVDLLTKRIPSYLITGILVNYAERETQKNIVESDDDNSNSDGLLAEIVNEIELEIKSLSGLLFFDEVFFFAILILFNIFYDKILKYLKESNNIILIMAENEREYSVQSKDGPESSSKKVTSLGIKDISKKQYQYGQQSSNKRRHIHERSVAIAALPIQTTEE